MSNINNERDAYSILGLQPGVSHNEIVKAYRKLVQEYHFDKIATWRQNFVTLPSAK